MLFTSFRFQSVAAASGRNSWMFTVGSEVGSEVGSGVCSGEGSGIGS